MRIQHNIMAMNAYRNYSTNTSALSKNLEKLSSGYKINRAGDDAAGLAISCLLYTSKKTKKTPLTEMQSLSRTNNTNTIRGATLIHGMPVRLAGYQHIPGK